MITLHVPRETLERLAHDAQGRAERLKDGTQTDWYRALVWYGALAFSITFWSAIAWLIWRAW